MSVSGFPFGITVSDRVRVDEKIRTIRGISYNYLPPPLLSAAFRGKFRGVLKENRYFFCCGEFGCFLQRPPCYLQIWNRGRGGSYKEYSDYHNVMISYY